MSVRDPNRDKLLGQTFVDLADTLIKDFDVDDLLQVLSTRCVELLDVDAAGLLLVDPSGRLRVVASSSDQVHLVELFELQNDEGPCLDCFRLGQPVTELDIQGSGRWPRFSARALEGGFRSVQAMPMRLREEVIGALNLFRGDPGALNENEIAIAGALASVATIGLLQERSAREARLLAEQLQVALNNRIVIEQAKGVLAERLGLDVGTGFEFLRRYGRSHNRRLVEVARALLEGHLSADDLE